MSRQNDTGGPAGREIEWHAGDMPYSPVFGDHFYSRSDGRAECRHVFLGGNDLPDRWRDCHEFHGRGAWVRDRPEFLRNLAALAGSPGVRTVICCSSVLKNSRCMATRSRGRFPPGRNSPNSVERLTEHWPEGPPGSVRIDFDDSVALELHRRRCAGAAFALGGSGRCLVPRRVRTGPQSRHVVKGAHGTGFRAHGARRQLRHLLGGRLGPP